MDNNVLGIFILLAAILGIYRTPRPYALLWSFATPVFYILFGFKSFYIDLGFTQVDLFSGVLPMVVCIMTWRQLTRTEKRRAWKYSPKLWWAFLGYYFLSLLWSNNISTGVRTVLEIAFPSILFLVAFNIIQTDEHLQKYFKWLMVINILVAIVDLYSAITGWAGIMDIGAMTEGAVGYRTVTAYFYVSMATILMMQMMDKFKISQLLLYIVNVGLLLLAASRTPTFVFIAGSLVAVLYRRNTKFTLIGIVTMGALLALLFLLPSRSKFLNTDDSLNMKDSGRSFFQKYFEDKANEGPLWGYGAGGTEDYAAWITQHITLVGAPHNEYLRIRFDGGIIGLCLFYAGLADLFLRGLWLGKSMKAYFPFKAVLIMTPIMFAVSCTNDNTFFYFYVFTQYLFCLMGFGSRLAYERRVLDGTEALIPSEDELEIIYREDRFLPQPAR